MKIYRSKRRSCSLCKPHKTGHEPRFTSRELAFRKETEKSIRVVVGASYIREPFTIDEDFDV